ncbi:MAG TPA: hypothetical protein VG605_06435 [Puia sp.]|nr:hypothetical protein [Puia sp.]
MKKNFTIPICLLFLFSFPCLSSQAQSWQDVGADSVAFNNQFYYASQAGLAMTLDTGGHPYILLVEGMPGNFGRGSVQAAHFDGTDWNIINPGLNSYPDAIAGAVDRAGNAYMGIDDGNTLPAVYKFASNAWSRIGAGLPNSGGNSPLSVALDSNGTPYYAYFSLASPTPLVYRYNGTAWTAVDTTGLDGAGGHVAYITFDRQGTLYIAYDEANPAPGQIPVLVVEKYTGAGWVQVGTKLYATTAQDILAFDNSNVPYVISTIGTVDAGFNFQLQKLSGGDWTPVGPAVSSVPGSPGVGGFPAASNSAGVAQIHLVIGPDDTPYIAWYQNTGDTNLSGAPQVMVDAYNGVSWVPVATNRVNQNAAMDNDCALAVDARGNLYVCYIDINQVTYVKKLEGINVATIMFADIITHWGAPDFPPGATSTNNDPGDPIRYSIADTTVAALVNGNIHILKTGFTTITASQPADANFSAANPVTVRLFVQRDSQAISFPGWPQKKVGDPDFPGGAYSSSGLPVTYEGSDPTIATVSIGGIIHIIERGAIIVTAHQAGDSNYLAAPDVSQVLIIRDSTDTAASSSPGGGKGRITAYSNSLSTLLVQVTAPADGRALLAVYNSFGYRVYSKEILLSVKGNNVFIVPAGRMPGGIYFVRVTGSGYNLVQPVWVR